MAESSKDEFQSPPLALEESPTISLMLQMQHQQQQQIQLQMQQQAAMQQQMAQLMSKLLSTNDDGTRQSPLTRAQPPRAKIERPKIDADCTDNQWVIFCDAWERYKQTSSLASEAEIRNELRSSCKSCMQILHRFCTAIKWHSKENRC